MLETIRDLMNTSCIVPDWLHDIFLGYDDPGAAHYSRLVNVIYCINFSELQGLLSLLNISMSSYELHVWPF